MANNSKYVEDLLLNWKRGAAAFPAAPTPYLALFSVMPADDGTGGTEVTSSFRATRLAFTAGAATTSTADAEQIANSVIEDFGNSTASSNVTIVGFGIYDSATIGSGNLLSTGALTSSVQVAPGSGFSFAVGALTELAS